MKINIKLPKPKKNYQKEEIKINPNKYWKFIVILFFVLLVGIFFFAFDLFKTVNNKNPDFINEQNKIIEKEKKEKLNKALEYFNIREEKSEEIINSSILVIDPSL